MMILPLPRAIACAIFVEIYSKCLAGSHAPRATLCARVAGVRRQLLRIWLRRSLSVAWIVINQTFSGGFRVFCVVFLYYLDQIRESTRSFTELYALKMQFIPQFPRIYYVRTLV